MRPVSVSESDLGSPPPHGLSGRKSVGGVGAQYGHGYGVAQLTEWWMRVQFTENKPSPVYPRKIKFD